MVGPLLALLLSPGCWIYREGESFSPDLDGYDVTMVGVESPSPTLVEREEAWTSGSLSHAYGEGRGELRLRDGRSSELHFRDAVFYWESQDPGGLPWNGITTGAGRESGTASWDSGAGPESGWGDDTVIVCTFLAEDSRQLTLEYLLNGESVVLTYQLSEVRP